MKDKLDAFGRLLGIMDDLRAKCPWDRKQTMESLSALTIEETYELVDAIIKKDHQEVMEEIGDLMLHMVFYAKIASEENRWDLAEALHAVCDKLVRRHPHIYGDINVDGEEEVRQNWERIKMSEGRKSVLQGVPNALPPLLKAQRMQEKTAKVGFEWENKKDVWAKVKEEIHEFEEAKNGGSKEARTEEFGDLIFALVNYARFEDIDVHLALEKTNTKFRKRVEYIEANADRQMSEMTLGEMDELWEESKRALSMAK
jgi:XTP/dITP diphosphohydrolase